MKVNSSDEGTNYYVCLACHGACDPKPQDKCVHDRDNRFEIGTIGTTTHNIFWKHAINEKCPYCKPENKGKEEPISKIAALLDWFELALYQIKDSKDPSETAKGFILNTMPDIRKQFKEYL
jgi:hypothetical protein